MEIPAGTDVLEPLPSFGGLAHGASLHDELQQLVAGGLTLIEAPQAATLTPALRFRTHRPGSYSTRLTRDMPPVNGDPMTNRKGDSIPSSDSTHVVGAMHILST